jgi:sarcosine oxidase
MAQDFDIAVIGKGMMGAAAARYLAQDGVNVALIGPDEPEHRQTHDGVFASHYDAGRITRTIDDDPNWALLARRSIDRYRELETKSGLHFYDEVGCVIATLPPQDGDSTMERMLAARDRVGSDAAFLDDAALRSTFPALHFPDGFVGLFEARHAGHIDPRALVRIETMLAASAGATVLPQEVTAIRDRKSHVEIGTRGGEVLSAERVVVAIGGFSNRPGLLPRPLDLTIKARTIVMVEVGPGELERYSAMPSVIQAAKDQASSFYVLPPIRYPDGKHYIKIGGDPTDAALKTDAEIGAWFRSEGNATAAAHMRRNLEILLPDLKGLPQKTAPCITTFTRHGYPYIGFAESERIVVLTGGNGMAAKSSDEIGRLAAGLAKAGVLELDGYSTDFSVCLL